MIPAAPEPADTAPGWLLVLLLLFGGLGIWAATRVVQPDLPSLMMLPESRE